MSVRLFAAGRRGSRVDWQDQQRDHLASLHEWLVERAPTKSGDREFQQLRRQSSSASGPPALPSARDVKENKSRPNLKAAGLLQPHTLVCAGHRGLADKTANSSFQIVFVREARPPNVEKKSVNRGASNPTGCGNIAGVFSQARAHPAFQYELRHLHRRYS